MTFEEIKEKLNNAGSYEDIENTISLIKDPKLRTQMQEFTNECEWENQDIKLVCIVLIEKFLDPKIDNNQLNELKETKTLPNISKFIYNLGQVDEDDKGIKERAWSVNDYTKDGLGNKIIIVSQNGISNLTAKDIKLSVEQAYPQLSGQITANKKGIWFYLKPIKGLKESKKKSDFDKLSDKISKEYIKKGMSKSKAEEIGNATAAKIARSKKTESEESNKEFTLEDVDKVAEELNLTFDKFTKEELLTGMNIELEHGTKFPETNVTDDDLIMTAKIALAHLNEYSNYYDEDVGLHNFERELEAALSNKEDKVEESKEVTESVISDKRKQQIFDNLIDYVSEHTTDEKDFYYSLRDIIGLTNEEMTQLGIDVKSLGINDEEDDLEESKELKESDESILRLAKNSIVNGKLPEEIKYKGKTYKQFYVIDPDNSGETSDIYYCNMENIPSGDPQESNDYFYLKVALNKTENGYKGIKEIRFAEDLTESKKVTESVISDMKKKGLYDYIVNEYYNMDKDKLADIAKEAVYILYNEDKDLIKTYKENLKEYTDIEDDVIEAADGHYMDYLSAHYSELSKSDLKDFAKEALALIMDNNLVDEYIKDLKDNTIWADDEEDLEESKEVTESEEKFSGVEFEKNIPHVMRYKQYDVSENENGETLYWVTQQFFTLEELKQFQKAFISELANDKFGFTEAYATVRDLSTYDLKEDYENGVLCYITKYDLDYEGYEEFCKEYNFDLNKGWLEESKEVTESDDNNILKYYNKVKDDKQKQHIKDNLVGGEYLYSLTIKPEYRKLAKDRDIEKLVVVNFGDEDDPDIEIVNMIGHNTYPIDKKDIDYLELSNTNDKENSKYPYTDVNGKILHIDDKLIDSDNQTWIVKRKSTVSNPKMGYYLKSANKGDYHKLSMQYAKNMKIEESNKLTDNNRKIKIGSKVYWIGAGNEISAEGEVIDFPVDGRMTIKWDDNEQNTYDITHPNIILADNYDNSVNESEESKKITESNEEEKNPYENIKVYMNTWGNYNEYGADAESIKGGWMTPDEALEWLDKQEIQEEEPFINDVDGKLPFEVDEYSNPKQVLEQIKDLQSLSGDEAKALSAIMESQNDNYEMCKEILDSGDYIFFPDVSDDDELGHAYVDMVGVMGVSNPEKYINQDEIEEEIRNSLEDSETEYSDEMISELAEEEIENNKNNEKYLDDHFDYEALGRDLDMDGYYFADTGAIYVM